MMMPSKQRLNVGLLVKLVDVLSTYNGYSGRIVTNRRPNGHWGTMFEYNEQGARIEQHFVYVHEDFLEDMTEDQSQLNNLHRRYMAVRLEALLDCLELLKVTLNLDDAKSIIASHIRKHAYLAHSDVNKCFADVNDRLGPHWISTSPLAVDWSIQAQKKTPGIMINGRPGIIG